MKIPEKIAKLETEYENLYTLVKELSAKVEKGFEDISSKMFKALCFIIGILLSISGTLIYTFVICKII